MKANGYSKYYEVNDANKKQGIWKRNFLGVGIYGHEVAEQKLNYVHFNLATEEKQLIKHDLDNHVSSARFYEMNIVNLDL